MPTPTSPPRDVDVAVVGGGPAGLAAALALGRQRRSVVVVDAGEPRNAPAHAVQAFLTRDGTPPAQLRGLARREVERYGVQLLDEVVTTVHRGTDDHLDVELADGGRIAARALVVTTGLVDELPDVPGLAALWGGDVVHCPYCHGWEVRDRTIGVLHTSPVSLHQAALFRQLSDDVVLLAHTGPTPDPDALAGLRARGVRVVDGEVTALETTAGRLDGVRLADGQQVPLGALVVATRMRARAGLLAGLGLQAQPHPSGMGDHVPSDPTGRTALPGVWVAGNVTDPSLQVIGAAAHGNLVGAMVNADLVVQDTAAARAAA